MIIWALTVAYLIPATDYRETFIQGYFKSKATCELLAIKYQKQATNRVKIATGCHSYRVIE